MKVKIPPVKPYFSYSDIEYILGNLKEILEGKGFLSQAKWCEEFEREFSKYIGTRHAATCSSGTAALEVALRCAGIRNGEVIVPTNSFMADATSVIASGNRPVFADCGHDLCVSPDSIREQITDKTQAVIAVHIGGLVSPSLTEIIDICKEHNLCLIEDACHAHGATLNGQMAGSFGIAGAFSFFSTKVMVIGEGGMITTDNESVYGDAKVLRDQSKTPHSKYIEYHEEIGSNWRMQEVSALIGMTQLKRLEDFVERRQEIAKIYNDALENVEGVEMLQIPRECRSSYYKYVLFLERGMDRLKIQQELKQKYGIVTGGVVYDLPLHLQPALKEFASGHLPNAEDLCKRHFVLPMYYEMTDEEAKHVVESFKKEAE